MSVKHDKSGNNLNDIACRLYNFIADPRDGEREFFFSGINLSSFFKKTNSVSSQGRNEKINITQKRIIQININFFIYFHYIENINLFGNIIDFDCIFFYLINKSVFRRARRP
jgi:hypothetical protein